MNFITLQQQQSRWQQQIKRMNRIAKYKQFYNNTYEDYVKYQLKKSFPKGYSQYYKFLRKFPITQRIIDDMSILFKNGFTYSYNGTDAQKDLLNNYINTSNLQQMMIIINRLVNLTYDVGIIPRYYATDDKIIFEVLTPDKCVVQQEQNFPTQIKQLRYLQSTYTDSLNTRQINKMTRITSQTISDIQIDSTGRIIKQDNIQQNPYGYIPVSWFNSEMNYDTFWTQKENPIIEMHIYYCIAKTYQAISLAYQAVSTLVTKGIPVNTTIPFGPMYWLDLPKSNGTSVQQSDAKYINPDTDFDSLFKSADYIQSQVAQYANMSLQAYRKASQFSSGYAMQISKSALFDYNKLQIPMFSNAISKLFKIIIDTINIYTNNIIPNIPVVVVIPQPKTMYTQQQIRQQYDWQIEKGIITVIDILKQKYPQYTIQEIELLYSNNKSIESDQQTTTTE